MDSNINIYLSWLELCVWLGMLLKVDSIEDTTGVVSDYLMIFPLIKF